MASFAKISIESPICDDGVHPEFYQPKTMEKICAVNSLQEYERELDVDPRRDDNAYRTSF